MEGERAGKAMNKGFFRWRGKSSIPGKSHKKPRMEISLQSPIGKGAYAPFTPKILKEVGR